MIQQHLSFYAAKNNCKQNKNKTLTKIKNYSPKPFFIKKMLQITLEFNHFTTMEVQFHGKVKP